MRDHESILLRRKVEQHRILRASQAGILNVENVDTRLTGPQAFDDIGVKVLISQEADRQVRFDAICRRASCRRAKRSGFVSLRGTSDRSISRWLSARYSLTVVSFSR